VFIYILLDHQSGNLKIMNMPSGETTHTELSYNLSKFGNPQSIFLQSSKDGLRILSSMKDGSMLCVNGDSSILWERNEYLTSIINDGMYNLFLKINMRGCFCGFTYY